MFVNGKSYTRYSRMKTAEGANQHTFFISICATISEKMLELNSAKLCRGATWFLVQNVLNGNLHCKLLALVALLLEVMSLEHRQETLD